VLRLFVESKLNKDLCPRESLIPFPSNANWLSITAISLFARICISLLEAAITSGVKHKI